MSTQLYSFLTKPKAKTKDALTIQSYASSFVPRDLETIIYGKETISLYPKVEYNWTLSKKAYAFTTSKASLADSKLETKVRLHLMGEQPDSNALIQVSIQNGSIVPTRK
eukprot:5635092-Ditylum_brightwellii.AAC.1